MLLYKGYNVFPRELEEITGVRPANLLWWRHELQDVIVTLEGTPRDGAVRLDARRDLENNLLHFSLCHAVLL